MAFVELIRESDGAPNHGAAFAHRPEIYRAVVRDVVRLADQLDEGHCSLLARERGG